MLTADDLRAAIAWRLEKIPPSEIATLAEALRPFAGRLIESDPDLAIVLNDLHRPGDRRSVWGLACAVLARDAQQRGEIALFWSAGFEVVKSLQQGKRGGHHNRQTVQSDALDELITEALADSPSVSSSALFDRFSKMAGAADDILVEFDKDKDELVCQLDDETLINVGRGEFERRMRRARRG